MKNVWYCCLKEFKLKYMQEVRRICWKNLDLWFLFPHGWFINGHLNGFLVIGDYDGPESAVLGVDLFVIDRPKPVEHQTVLIPAEKTTDRVICQWHFLEFVLLICLLDVWPSPVRNWHHFIIWLVSHNVIDEA